MSELEAVLTDVSELLTDGSAGASRRAIQEALAALRGLLRTEVALVSRFTSELPVGAHVSVPVLGPGGFAQGTLCCFSRYADEQLRARDEEVLTAFARLIARHMEVLVRQDRHARRVSEAVEAVLGRGGPRIALQPVVEIATGRHAGYEALSRFPAVGGLEGWGPERWFREADAVGVGHQLEAAAIRAALVELPRLPRRVSLSVNVSARALCESHAITRLVTGPHAPRLVVELTEHAAVDDYDALAVALDRTRAAGARIAVDDAGSGYAGLHHILRLRPEVLKLDRSLVEGVAADPSREAMCAAMVSFTRSTGSWLVAEGVETAEDLAALRRLGVPLAQGYHLGRPEIPSQPVPEE